MRSSIAWRCPKAARRHRDCQVYGISSSCPEPRGRLLFFSRLAPGTAKRSARIQATVGTQEEEDDEEPCSHRNWRQFTDQGSAAHDGLRPVQGSGRDQRAHRWHRRDRAIASWSPMATDHRSASSCCAPRWPNTSCINCRSTPAGLTPRVRSAIRSRQTLDNELRRRGHREDRRRHRHPDGGRPATTRASEVPRNRSVPSTRRKRPRSIGRTKVGRSARMPAGDGDGSSRRRRRSRSSKSRRSDCCSRTTSSSIAGGRRWDSGHPHGGRVTRGHRRGHRQGPLHRAFWQRTSARRDSSSRQRSTRWRSTSALPSNATSISMTVAEAKAAPRRRSVPGRQYGTEDRSLDRLPRKRRQGSHHHHTGTDRRGAIGNAGTHIVP